MTRRLDPHFMRWPRWLARGADRRRGSRFPHGRAMGGERMERRWWSRIRYAPAMIRGCCCGCGEMRERPDSFRSMNRRRKTLGIRGLHRLLPIFRTHLRRRRSLERRAAILRWLETRGIRLPLKTHAIHSFLRSLMAGREDCERCMPFVRASRIRSSMMVPLVGRTQNRAGQVIPALLYLAEGFS